MSLETQVYITPPLSSTLTSISLRPTIVGQKIKKEPIMAREIKYLRKSRRCV